ncbi:MAG: radical SAM protein, partial [Spirochaetaceae bacterium]|nr:radical SAM protein [Spirochaetaceae bacterium]
LLRSLVDGTRTVAFRISSYEPDRVDAEFLEAFAHPRVRPHLHLSVQSASDGVLARMGRAYGREGLERAVEGARRVKGDPFLAADLIVGFPGESEADFAQTRDFALRALFAWIHAFPFSPRPGTRAASMPSRVPERVAGERVSALAEIARRGKEGYVARWLGRELVAVLEAPPFATTENYLKVAVRSLPEGARPGRAFRCRIVQDGTAPAVDGAAGSPEPKNEVDGFAEVSIW